MSQHASRPVIGVSAYVEPVDRSVWVQQHSAVLPHRYVDHIERAGAIAVILPPRHDADDDMADAVLARLDGLVIAGGADVEAVHYDAEPHPTVAGTARRPRRVGARPVARVRRAGPPGAGDLPGHAGHGRGGGRGARPARARTSSATRRTCPRPGEYSSHHATPVAGTRLAELLGTGTLAVPTYHHQAVEPDSLGDTAYRPSAWHEDGTLEAMEDPSAPFRLAVQWHPEAGEDTRLFDALVVAAREQAERGESGARARGLGVDGAAAERG